MNDRDVLVDLLAGMAEGMREEVGPLTEAELAWQPDPLANGVGVTVWHVARWLDVLAVRVLDDRPAEAELWHIDGWTERTGYDPRGIGYLGLGVITGYTAEEAAAVPILPAADLLRYLDSVVVALNEKLLSITSEELHGPAPGLGTPRPGYNRVRGIVSGVLGHLGEVAALNAQRRRREDAALAEDRLVEVGSR